MNENDFERQVEQEEQQAADSVPNQETEEIPSGTVNEIVEKVKELVKKGNVTKIVIKKNDNILVNIPVNVGIVGGVIGLVAAPWAIVAAAVATAGFACKVEIVKNDGEVVDVNAGTVTDKAKDWGKDIGEFAQDIGDKAKDFGSAVIDGIKDAIDGNAPADADFETVVEQTENAEAPASEEPPAEEPPAEE